MDLVEAASILFFKVIWPTVDVVSDWIFGVKLIIGFGYDLQCSDSFPEDHVNMGLVALIPPTLSALIHLHHWYHFEKVENGGSGRLKTFPVIILQVRSGKNLISYM